ncbi:hypothetical protein GCM10025868_16910 [Angustibacter aerolatus]|uniref:Uncharacterized protein n=1 Tax=Angustibacter aerolatus TaxID=1162965 RepID=A0ABQ6JE14_9ACTN|nr:hypothetical protein GCM10025868_16910 [Angustibacter aerolatus]
MWLPALERTGRRFAVVTRGPEALAAVAEVTTAPVVSRAAWRDLDDVVVPSARVALYVNAASTNTNFVGYRRLVHVYLGHGESDKALSYHPSHAMFDRVLVAGQAAIERYGRHGIDISLDRFVVVGRPLLGAIAPAGPRPGDDLPVVLYAPTWAGYNAARLALVAAGGRGGRARPALAAGAGALPAAPVQPPAQRRARLGGRGRAGCSRRTPPAPVATTAGVRRSSRAPSSPTARTRATCWSPTCRACSSTTSCRASRWRWSPQGPAPGTPPTSPPGTPSPGPPPSSGPTAPTRARCWPACSVPTSLARERAQVRRFYLGGLTAEQSLDAFTAAITSCVEARRQAARRPRGPGRRRRRGRARLTVPPSPPPAATLPDARRGVPGGAPARR